jgi:HSP20 family molecular chaperone IbpA
MRKFYEDLMRQMEHDMRRSEEMMRRFLQAAGPADKFWEPPVDVYETADALHVKAELAGVHPDKLQVELSVDGRALVIRGSSGWSRSRPNRSWTGRTSRHLTATGSFW